MLIAAFHRCRDTRSSNTRRSKRHERLLTARTRRNCSTRPSTLTSHSFDRRRAREDGEIDSHIGVVVAGVAAAAQMPDGNENENENEMIMMGNDQG